MNPPGVVLDKEFSVLIEKCDGARNLYPPATEMPGIESGYHPNRNWPASKRIGRDGIEDMNLLERGSVQDNAGKLPARVQFQSASPLDADPRIDQFHRDALIVEVGDQHFEPARRHH